MREKVHYLGRVIARDKEGAIDRAMEEFRIEPARRFWLIAESAERASGRRNIFRRADDLSLLFAPVTAAPSDGTVVVPCSCSTRGIMGR